MKKILCTLMILCMTLSLLPTAALAASMADPSLPHTISAGYDVSAVIDEAGVLRMWGDNTFGQLGNGQAAESVDKPLYESDPVKVLDNVVAVSIGGGTMYHPYSAVAAIRADNSLWMWGTGYHNRINSETSGNATVDLENWFEGDDLEVNLQLTQTVPVQVMEDVSAVSLGAYCGVAVKTDNTLWAWGDFGDYESGLIYDEPVKVMDDVVAATAGTMCAAAIKSDGSLWMWGNDHGYLGWEYEEGQYFGVLTSTPTKVMDDVTSVSIGWNWDSGNTGVVAAIKTDGSLWMWGENKMLKGMHDAELSTEYLSADPVKVMEQVQAVDVGFDRVAVIKEDGSLWVFWQEYTVSVNRDDPSAYPDIDIQKYEKQIMTDAKDLDIGVRPIGEY